MKQVSYMDPYRQYSSTIAEGVAAAGVRDALLYAAVRRLRKSVRKPEISNQHAEKILIHVQCKQQAPYWRAMQ